MWRSIIAEHYGGTPSRSTVAHSCRFAMLCRHCRAFGAPSADNGTQWHTAARRNRGERIERNACSDCGAHRRCRRRPREHYQPDPLRHATALRTGRCRPCQPARSRIHPRSPRCIPASRQSLSGHHRRSGRLGVRADRSAADGAIDAGSAIAIGSDAVSVAVNATHSVNAAHSASAARAVSAIHTAHATRAVRAVPFRRCRTIARYCHRRRTKSRPSQYIPSLHASYHPRVGQCRPCPGCRVFRLPVRLVPPDSGRATRCLAGHRHRQRDRCTRHCA